MSDPFVCAVQACGGGILGVSVNGLLSAALGYPAHGFGEGFGMATGMALGLWAAASVGRSGNRQDRETGLDAQHERAVANGETPTPGPAIDQDGGEV